MATPVHIKDPATGLQARVTNDKAIFVNNVTTSANDLTPAQLTRRKIFQMFVSNSAGSIELNVNGSVTPQEFKIPAQGDRTISIRKIRLLFNSVNMTLTVAGDLRRFGPVAAPGLTNGITGDFYQSGITTSIFTGAVQTIGGFFDSATSYANFPNGIAAGVDFLSLDFTFEEEIILPATFTDFMRIRVSDNLTGLALFRCLALGWQELA
jgi:hypothetical protein